VRPKRRQVYHETAAGGLELTAVGGARILRRLGEGVSCVAYLAEWRGEPAVLKIYKAAAIERHARYHPVELAEFEYRRNLAFYEAPGLEPHVARPLAYLVSGGVAAMLQERLEGQLYYHHWLARGGRVAPGLFGQVERIVELAHAAGLYDLDLNSANVMVVEVAGEPRAKLFDFNLIPFHENRAKPLVYLAARLGLVDPRARDRRKLRTFHTNSGVARKLDRFTAAGIEQRKG
jgi:hypothetical protein